jgi:hypothetical protein
VENIAVTLQHIPIIGWIFFFPWADRHMEYDITVGCTVKSVCPAVQEEVQETASGTAKKEDEKPKTIRNLLRVALSKAEDRMAEKTKPRSKEDLVARQKKLEAGPTIEALKEADDHLAGGRVPHAWNSVYKAELLASKLNQPDVGKQVAAAKEKVRLRLVDYFFENVPSEAASGAVEEAVKHHSWLLNNATDTRKGEVQKLKEIVYESGLTAIREKLLPQDKVEEAQAGANALVALVGGNDEKLAALRSEVQTKAKALSAALAEEAGKMNKLQCYEAEAKLNRALALDPTNAQAKELQPVVKKCIALFTPAYVKDVHAQIEGNGYLVWFTLANKDGVLVPAPGEAEVRFAGVSGGYVAMELGGATESVPADSYTEHEVGIGGIGGKKLMHVCKRIPFPNVGGGYRFLDLRDTFREERFKSGGMRLRVILTFKPKFGNAIQLAADAPIPD